MKDKIAHSAYSLDVGHAIYLGTELAAAEMAIARNMKFEQDTIFKSSENLFTWLEYLRKVQKIIFSGSFNSHELKNTKMLNKKQGNSGIKLKRASVSLPNL